MRPAVSICSQTRAELRHGTQSRISKPYRLRSSQGTWQYDGGMNGRSYSTGAGSTRLQNGRGKRRPRWLLWQPLLDRFDKRRNLLQILEIAHDLDPGFHLVQVGHIVRDLAGFVQGLLQLLLADRRAEFYGVAFDHGFGCKASQGEGIVRK